MPLELEASHNLSRSWSAVDRAVVDEPESRSKLPVHFIGGAGLRVQVGGIVQVGPVEHIEQFRANLEAHPFLYSEDSAQAHLLVWPALVAIVAVISSGSAELPGRRL